MLMSLNREPIWVATQNDLQLLAAELNGSKQIAVDTESNSLFAYREQVCLIQFSTETADFLLDSLALTDLSQLAPIFSSKKITKIFHAAEYDLICLKRDFNFTFAQVFDTMIAARILGYKAFGLASILEKEFNVSLNKRYQRANWGKRPLPKEQLDYARLDTHFLIELKNRFERQLKDNNLFELVREDFERLLDVQVTTHENGFNLFWRVAAKSDLKGKQLAVLYELYEYRDQQARKSNLPPFKIFNDKTLIEIVQKCPEKYQDLAEVTGMTRRVLKKHASNLLSAVQEGQKKRAPRRPARIYPSERFMQLHDTLKTWRKETARQYGIESDIVLPKDILEEIARKDPDNIEQLQTVMKTVPYRYKKYGHAIIQLLKD